MSRTETELFLRDDGAVELAAYVKGFPNFIGYHELGTFKMTVVFYDDDEVTVIDHRNVEWGPDTFPAERLQEIVASMTVNMMKEMIGC